MLSIKYINQVQNDNLRNSYDLLLCKEFRTVSLFFCILFLSYILEIIHFNYYIIVYCKSSNEF
jgi:hypothetical protein